MIPDLQLQTVPRSLVHRRAVSEVYVTHLGKEGDNDFLVGGQLPRKHFFYNDHTGAPAGHYDPLLVMEAARQAAMAVVHQYFGAPLEMAFQVRTFNGTRPPMACDSTWEVGAVPADLTMKVWTTREHRKGERLFGVDMVLDIAADGRPLLTVDGSFSWVTREQWATARTAYRTSVGLGGYTEPSPTTQRAQPACVGRRDADNVVIGPVVFDGHTGRAVLAADTSHPVLFDHPLDHVPGSVLIEAGRQAGLALLLERNGGRQAPLHRVASTFVRFVELDAPAECVVTEVASDATGIVVRCDVEQFGSTAASLELTSGPEFER